METWLSFEVEKLLGYKLTPEYLDQLNKIYQLKNPKRNLRNCIKLFYEQILLEIPNIFERFVQLEEYIKPRDSSSLKSFVLKYGEEEGRRKFDEKTSKSLQSLENFVARYGKEGPEKYRLYCVSKSMGYDGFVYRYGEEVGREKWREFWDNTKFGTSLSHFISRHGDIEGPIEYEKFRKSQGFNNTLESYIFRYGPVEGTEKYLDTNQRKSISQMKDTMVIRMLSEGYSMIDIFSAVTARWFTTSEAAFISRYGKDVGKEKYDLYVKSIKEQNPICLDFYTSKGIDANTARRIISSIQSSRSKGKSSKESFIHLDPIIRALTKTFETSCLYGKHEYTIALTDKEKELSGSNKFKYDLTISEINLIVEYHGYSYHDDIDYNITKSCDFDAFVLPYKKDLFKKWVAENRGFDVFLIRSWKLEEDKIKLFEHLRLKGMDEKWKQMFI